MNFPEVAPLRSECQRLITEALRSGSMRLYVDASVLIHCFEISRSACEELLSALDGFGDAVKVPVWSAKETWDHTRGLPSRRPLAKTASALTKRLQEFRSETLRYVDERTFDDMSLEQYTTDVEEAVSTVERLTRRAENFEPGHDHANARLLPFIASHTLTSDLPFIYDEVQRTAETRFSHEVPPGFADGGQKSNSVAEPDGEEPVAQQKGKKRNRYGDLIMWLEALADIRDAGREHLIILTRDNSKRDWVYKPERVMGDDGRLQQNGGLITLPLPLLVQEAKQRCPGLSDVHVISLEMFVTVIRSVSTARVGNLVRALQAGIRPPRQSVPRSERTGEQVDVVATTSEISFSSHDMMYEPSREEALTPVWQHIAGLRAEGWSAQNDASSELPDLIPNATALELKQIGRGVVAASSEDAVGPVDLAHLVLDSVELPAATRGNFLVGMLAETYFDESGEPKKPAAHPDIATALYDAAESSDTRRAFEVTVDDALGPMRRLYLALPSEAEREINLQLQLDGQVLRGLQANDVELLEANAPESRRIAVAGGSVDVPLSELIEAIAREFVVPARMLHVEGPTNFQVTIPERMGFISWGPNTAERLR